MSEKTRCLTCNKLLIKCEEIHAVDGFLFCSEECATNFLEDDIRTNAHEMAVERYAAEAEVVLSKDILADEFKLSGTEIYTYIKKMSVSNELYNAMAVFMTDLSSEAFYDILNSLEAKGFTSYDELTAYLGAGDNNG